MNKIIGIVLMVLGVALLIFGFSAADSFSSDVSEFFSGTPTDKSMWLIIGGAVSLIAGIALTAFGRNSKVV